jgi:hypothetical protein
MAQTSYQYSIANDTLNGLVNTGKIQDEIQNSAIIIALDYINTEGDNLNIYFKDALSSGDKTILDSLIASHDGIKTVVNEVVELSSKDSSGTNLIAIQKPVGDFNTIITHNFCDNNSWSQTNDSSWKLEPSAGEIYRVQKAEVQFEHDVNISINSNELYLDYYAWIGGGAKALAQRITFKHMRDIFEYGNAHYHAPSLPEISTGLSTVIFDYANKLSFYGDDNPGKLAYLEISTKNNVKITGSYATVGFVTNTESP